MIVGHRSKEAAGDNARIFEFRKSSEDRKDVTGYEQCIESATAS